MKYFFWDTETTGLGFSDEVLQLGGIVVDEDFNIVEVVNFFCDTTCPISQGAAAINHLTFELVHKWSGGKTFEDNWLELKQRLGYDVCWIGWNESFDRRVVNQTLKKAGLPLYNFGKLIHGVREAEGICHYDLMRGIGKLRNGGKTIKLMNAVTSYLRMPVSEIDKMYEKRIKQFDMEVGAHHADYDAFMCYLLFIGVIYGNL